MASRPARGAWVEILILIDEIGVLQSRPARGAWVEIMKVTVVGKSHRGRAPQGARGLKYIDSGTLKDSEESRPARGAWVEISIPALTHNQYPSRPARGAWVEMMKNVSPNQSIIVAPRKGRVG